MTRVPSIPGLIPSLTDHEQRIQILEAVPGSGSSLAWTPLVLQNGWSTGFVAPAVAQSGGITLLRGNMKGGLMNARVATLDAQFWPSSYQVQYAMNYGSWPTMLEIDSSNGDIYIYNQAGEHVIYGYPRYFTTDDGSTYDTVGGVDIAAGYPVTSASPALDILYGGNLNSPYYISSVSGDSEPRRILAGTNGWGIDSGPLGYRAWAVRHFEGPFADSMAEIEIVDASYTKLGLVVRAQNPFSSTGTTYPLGLYFTIDDAGNWALGEATLPDNLATPYVFNSGSTTAPGVGDVISLTAIGDYLTAFINGTVISSAGGLFYAQGYPGFGLDASSNGITVVTNFRYGYPDPALWTPDADYFLDGVNWGS